MNLYSVLGVESSASALDISRSFRKLALRWHPDKNRDNPSAEQVFHSISSAYQVLSDEVTRAEYDRVYSIKRAEKERTARMDSARRQMKEKLETGEREGKKRRMGILSADDQKRRMLEDEGKRLVEEMNLTVQQEWQRKKERKMDHPAKLKVKWNVDVSYDEQQLKSLFSPFGELLSIVVSKSAAVLEFSRKSSARIAKDFCWDQMGHPHFKFSLLESSEETNKLDFPTSVRSTDSRRSAITIQSDEYERQTLQRLLEAAKKQQMSQ